MGRPKGTSTLKNDEATVSTIVNCARIQCTQTEIAGVLGVNPATVTRFFKQHPDVKDKFYGAQEEGKAALRRVQFKQAQSSVPMSIWLGKQYLKQADRHATDITGGLNSTVQINVVVEENNETKVIDHQPEALVLDHVAVKDETDV